MTNLADFLLARIAEDEAVAGAATQGRWKVVSGDSHVAVIAGDGEPVLDAWAEFAADSGLSADDTDLRHITRHDPARVLAECDAKRRIVNEMANEVDQEQADEWFAIARYITWMKPGQLWLYTLQCLALPYADHPGYRAEWRP